MAVSNEYLIQKETLTAIADEVRTLSGATVDMNPSEMTANISVANTEVSSQYALLEQAIAALEGKAAGGIELPELTSPAANYEVFSGKEYIDRYGNKTTGSFSIDNELSQQDNLITQIQSALEGRAIGGSGGSGLPAGITELNMGSFDYASDYIGLFGTPHGLSRKPNFHIIYADTDAASVGENYMLLDFGIGLATPYSDYYSEQCGYTTTMNSLCICYNWGTEVDEEYIWAQSESNTKLKAGVTYRWIAGVTQFLP